MRKPNYLVFMCLVMFFIFSIEISIKNQTSTIFDACAALFCGIMAIISKFSNFSRREKKKHSVAGGLFDVI